jgi:hypothetical protein
VVEDGVEHGEKGWTQGLHGGCADGR